MSDILKISILNTTETEDFEKLCELLKKFTIDTYVRNKPENAEIKGNEKAEKIRRAIEEFNGKEQLSVLSNKDVEQIKKDIEIQIKDAKNHININKENVETRYYIIKDGDEVVAFQQAQVSKKQIKRKNRRMEKFSLFGTRICRGKR